MRRTSRGRRDLPESLSEVDGIWVGWEGCGGRAVDAEGFVDGPPLVGGACCC